MTFDDWRDADPATVDGLYAAERERWLDGLQWETRRSWAIVEAGRQRGHVCGWILRDGAARVRGWTYYLLFEGELQIGALCADRAVDVRALLDCVMDSPEAGLASTISCFAYPTTPSFESALRRRRFAIRRSLYLSRPLTSDDEGAVPAIEHARVRPYRQTDLLSAVRLMATAYEGAPGAVCFAPRGRLDEWVRYARQLVEAEPCGPFLAGASFAAEEAGTGRLLGLVLTTAVRPDTAHVAQIVVAPQAARRGIGRSLLAHAFGASRAAGHRAITLMVDEGNEPARALYARHGFGETSAFLSARRPGSTRVMASSYGARRSA